jgi:type II secretory pathway pseudopilin PulG
MLWNKLNQKGLTLVETLVGMGLLSMAITLGMNFVSEQVKTRDTRTKQTIHRYIAIQVTQHVTNGIAYYPPIAPLNPTDKIVYVGCMTRDGVLIANTFKFVLTSNFDERVSTGKCALVDTAYEVRFFWVDANVDSTVKINILTLAPGTINSLAVRNFKIFAK